ncbi:HISTONE DEACETYLASE HDT3-LIKE ISOFORM X1 [Salix purpurea]|uniref:HISTONE DEACETYLASE HDT3-LIKE ISOFORM X1 n=1 Tax=Salix purpurea TaxID=77065 RepID=A0A9Q0SXF2_SALPP|nr:HISTONE DEACETYLASE HDT3-LIKE ISOFORM X1 [Salix purpurea]
MIHLSQAALGESKKGRESVPLFVKVNEKKIVLGTLSPENIPQLSFDLVFETEFELSHNWKNGSVFFCGYQVIPDDDASEFSSDEEDFEFAMRTILTRMMSQKRVCLLMKIWMIPLKAETSKKRANESATKTPVSSKKAKAATPQKSDVKKPGQVTPHPSKGKAAANGNSSKSPKSGGNFSCKSCEKSFGTDGALKSHSQAKHAAK